MPAEFCTPKAVGREGLLRSRAGRRRFRNIYPETDIRGATQDNLRFFQIVQRVGVKSDIGTDILFGQYGIPAISDDRPIAIALAKVWRKAQLVQQELDLHQRANITIWIGDFQPSKATPRRASP